jgi:ribosomal protein S27AE
MTQVAVLELPCPACGAPTIIPMDWSPPPSQKVGTASTWFDCGRCHQIYHAALLIAPIPADVHTQRLYDRGS